MWAATCWRAQVRVPSSSGAWAGVPGRLAVLPGCLAAWVRAPQPCCIGRPACHWPRCPDPYHCSMRPDDALPPAVPPPAMPRTAVDENRRSALHFAAAMNKVPLVERLLAAQAEVDLADKEGERCTGSRQQAGAGVGGGRSNAAGDRARGCCPAGFQLLTVVSSLRYESPRTPSPTAKRRLHAAAHGCRLHAHQHHRRAAQGRGRPGAGGPAGAQVRALGGSLRWVLRWVVDCSLDASCPMCSQHVCGVFVLTACLARWPGPLSPLPFHLHPPNRPPTALPP